MSYFPLTSVTTLQGTNPWVMTGSVQGSFSPSGNQSVSGTVFALQTAGSIMAVSTTVNTGNSSVQLVGGTAMAGSIAAYQGATAPWRVELTSGSIATTAGTTGNSSVQLVGGTAMTGSVTAYQGVSPWTVVETSGSILSTPGSVQLMAGTNMVGSVVAYQGVANWSIGNTSVMLTTGTNAIGSVATLQGTNPWIVSGSTSMVGGPINIGSMLGSYGVNSVFANNNTGDAAFGVRNDAIASLIGTNLGWGPLALDAMGRQLIQPFAPWASSVMGITSTVNAGDIASVLVISAAGTGLKNYVTDFMVANTGSVATLITFTEGGASILGKTIAPAGGGSNMPGMAGLLKNQHPGSPINMVVGTASSTVHITMYGFTAP